VPGDGVVTGHGTINGRLVYVFSQDFTVFGCALSAMHATKICKVMDAAMKVGAPVAGINDSGGARIQEGVDSLAGYADVFQRNVMASGVIPQISMVMVGPCAGGAVYSPAMTDFIFMVKDSSYRFVTGPDVVKTVTHETVTQEELGGALTHTRNRASAISRSRMTSRRCCSCAASSTHSVEQPREGARCGPPTIRSSATISRSIRCAGQSQQALRHQGSLILKVVDEGDFFELSPEWAGTHGRRLAAGWTARLGLRRQPADGAGGLPRHRFQPQGGARFVRFCDAFNIPIVTFVDVPGFPAGHGPRKYGAIIKHGAKLLYAYAEATVAHGDRDHPQGLWRRLRRPWRPSTCVGDMN